MFFDVIAIEKVAVDEKDDDENQAHTKIGKDIDTAKIVKINDIARLSGTYILGKPGMGKSNLIEKFILTNFDNANSIFFLDPHGESIERIVKCLNKNGGLIILDPEDEEYSFGINPLACNDLTSLKERVNTYTRAYNIFYKIWEEDWGVWLQLIIQNTLYVFLENPDYTLADVPLFFTNENFRRYLANNVKYNPDVRDFWLTRFTNKREYDQQRQVDAALTRISILLGHPYIKHIIGQTETTVDFSDMLTEGGYMFLKLSAALAPDIKKFIGTIVIGELLHHVRRRPPDKRDPFFIYIDEFQNFANSDDLATFITEARKFGIATTIAHQERYGQLGDSKKMMGATLAAANMIFFQLTIKDAEELASIFARDPPPETEYDNKQYVISQSPVWDLMKGHGNSSLMKFVNKYLRPMKDRLTDIVGEQELNRFIQQEYTQDASYFRISAKRWPTDEHTYAAVRAKRNAMLYEEKAILSAKQQTDKLKALVEEAINIQQMLRKINTLFVQIMEEKIDLSSESFDQAVISIFKHVNIAVEKRNLLEFYLSVYIYNTKCMYAVPYIFAKSYGLFPEECARIENEVEEDYNKRLAHYDTFSYEQKYHTRVVEYPTRNLPANLSPRRFSSADLNNFGYMACKLLRDDDNVLDLVERLINACVMLAEPENHIMAKSSQYVEKKGICSHRKRYETGNDQGACKLTPVHRLGENN